MPDGHHHDLGEVNATIDALDASERAKDDMRAVYRILAEAEATAHGCAVEETHFHEVGNGEALRNVLAICLAVEALDPDEIAATRVQTGSRHRAMRPRRAAHPAPATAAIIARGTPRASASWKASAAPPRAPPSSSTSCSATTRSNPLRCSAS